MAMDKSASERESELFQMSEKKSIHVSVKAVDDDRSSQHDASDEESAKIESSSLEDSESEEKPDVNIVCNHAKCMRVPVLKSISGNLGRT